jgi:hypothetical protein
MDAEYNMNNKLLGKRLLAHAEKAVAVSEDQHGSRKNHKAQLAILIKQQLMDTLRVQHRCGAIAMNNAKGCYDRIVHTVAILVLMSFGLNHTVAQILFQVL